MLLRHAAATDVGRVRHHNEDTYAIENGDGRAQDGALFVVCDGMGGYERGEVASDVAARTIVAQYHAHTQPDPGALLQAAFAAANHEVRQQGNGEMGTTAVAALVRSNVATIANVGDCRAYLVRDGQPQQITRDHSFVAEQVAAGILTAEQAKESSYRHIVTRAIGHRGEFDVDIYQQPLAPGDVLVLCSDGLHGQIEAADIALAVTRVPLQTACDKLVGLANTRGGPDNITIIAVKVEELDDAVPSPPTPTADISAGSTTTPAASTIAPVAAVATGADGTTPASNGTTARTTTSPLRAAQVTPPLAKPAPAQHDSHGVMRWLATLLMVAAVSFGGYSLWRARPVTAPNPPLVAPPLTPIGATATATGDTPLTDAIVTDTAVLTGTAMPAAPVESATP
jgi:protein phosphatase